MKGLEAYKLDKAYTEGVDIRLDNAPEVVFKVRLPSQYNRTYTQAMYGGIQLEISKDGAIKDVGPLMSARWAQEDAFLAACLVSIDGEPVPDDWAQEYPAALQELMEKASKMSLELDQEVNSAAKKLFPLSSGAGDGDISEHSMPSSRGEAG